MNPRLLGRVAAVVFLAATIDASAQAKGAKSAKAAAPAPAVTVTKRPLALFNYNGEFHGLRRRHNQKDFTVRMQQFFDHHLKAAPKPEWMEKGVLFVDREEEKERFLKGIYKPD